MSISYDCGLVKQSRALGVVVSIGTKVPMSLPSASLASASKLHSTYPSAPSSVGAKFLGHGLRLICVIGPAFNHLLVSYLSVLVDLLILVLFSLTVISFYVAHMNNSHSVIARPIFSNRVGVDGDIMTVLLLPTMLNRL